VITGKLGQNHRDVLDAIIVARTAWRATSEGDAVVLVDSTRLRSALGWRRWRYEHLLDALRDLRAAEIRLVVEGRATEWSGILLRIRESQDTPPPARQKGGCIRGRRIEPWLPPTDPDSPRAGMLWEVTVSRAWLELRRRLPTRYPIEICRMRYGVSQAVARLMLSHGPGTHYRLATALDAVGVPLKRRARARLEIEADGDLLRAAGIVVSADWEFVDHLVPVKAQKA